MAGKKTKELAEKLLVKKMHTQDAGGKDIALAQQFCDGYKLFLDKGKTERESTEEALSLLKKAGYKPFKATKKYKLGDKVFVNHRNKGVIALTVGSRPLEEGVRFSIAHLDSPRLDLKPSPLYEADELACFKTHYYGGIRKYQWVAIPLSMHGVVVKNDGSMVEVNVGEKPGDPVFTVTDLLPHLSGEQNKRTLADGIRGEELNILIGSLPFEDKEASDRVKLETMRLLNEQYGFTEHDFVRAEIEFVPAFPARDVGFDKSLLGAYGQDDRVCAYTALMAEIDTKAPANTTVCVLTDKEETGSQGNTGLAGDYLLHFLEDLADLQGSNIRTVLANSICLSADVNAAYDPTFGDAYEKKNSCFVNHGVVVTKYTGVGGKSGTNDASAELMGYVTNLLDRHGVAWQTGELGKVDGGGGGTIARFMGNRNVSVVDLGVGVLSMHSPFEVTAKLDVYSMYKAFVAFNSDDAKGNL